VRRTTPCSQVPGIRRGTRIIAVGLSLTALLSGARLDAQVSTAVASSVDRARGMMDAGSGDAARALLDSLVARSAPRSDDMAESLYWRAVLSESTAEAERDWKRLVIEVPLSARAPSALLRLGELDILRGRPSGARAHFERIVRDFPEDAARPKAEIWIARSYFEERDIANACTAVRNLQTTGVPEGELRLQVGELQGRCRTAGTATAGAGTATAGAGTAAAGGIVFTVQLAAFNTRREANAFVARLAKRGVKARIDGDKKPFRVRVGRYDSREEATAMLAKLKRQGQSGFLAELPR